MTRRIPKSEPNPGNGFNYVPTPSNGSLTDEQVTQIAKTMYSRFYYYEGMPVWSDALASKLRENMINVTKQVLESSQINGFKLGV